MTIPPLPQPAEPVDRRPSGKGRDPSKRAGGRSPIAALVRHAAALANSKAVITAIAVTLGAAATTGAIVSIESSRPDASSPAPGTPAWHRLHPVHTPPLPVRPQAYLGAYEPTSPDSYSGMKLFTQTVGRPPNLALYYSGWWEPFRTSFAKEAYAAGATTAVQIDPSNPPHNTVSIAGIVAGEYDPYLEKFADQVADFGHQVVVGFGHEPDGLWYSWGENHISPSVWVAAWQHVVAVFRQQGADNVTWLWTMNVLGDQTQPLSAYWPGASYVNWVGIDGYYQNPQNTYAQVFGRTIVAVRKITNAPILIAETASGTAGTEPSQIADLYAGIRAFGNLGFIWFDMNVAHEPYRLEGDEGAIEIFRRMIRPWRLERPSSASTGGSVRRHDGRAAST
jgi:mannan endo-1,4-beta-mannosidase